MSRTPRDAGLFRRFERSFLVRGAAILLPAATLPVLAAGCAGERIAGSSGSCCSEVEWRGTAAVARAYAGDDAAASLDCPPKIVGTGTVPSGVPADAGAVPYGDLDLVPSQNVQSNGDRICVYRSVRCCPGGRPLFAGADEPRPIVAARGPGARWSRAGLPALGTSLPPELRAVIAQGWLEDALAEHASVASFARATLELVAVGAPPSLLAAHQRAALQEIRHAQRCFALARAYGDLPVDPGALAVPSARGGGFVRLATDTFVEGCVAESMGALMAARALEACTLPETRFVLEMIAADEAAHAALAWRTLAWALRQGGEPATRAVLARAASLRDELRIRGEDSGPVTAAERAELRVHGRLTDDDVRCAARDAWALLIDPLLAKLHGKPSTRRRRPAIG